MLDRRSFLQVALALGACGTAPGSVSRAMATQALKQSQLLRFDALGQVTLLHFTDIHAQLKPLFFREPSVNIGVGDVARKPPHLTGREYLDHYGIEPRSALAHALTAEDFAALAMAYGRVGGVDRLATLIYAIRAEREHKTLLLDGGDTWQGSYTALATRGADMVRVMNALGVDAMTAHWEYTYGQARVEQLIKSLNFPLLAGNVFDNEWNEAVFDSTAYFERGGVKIAVIGQAFPYTPIANPRYKIPSWSFGVREDVVRNNVAAARAEGAELVVLLSHNGFDVDRKLAGRTQGIDVILTGHTHDALPAVVEVNKTLLIASGSHGKFLSRLDLEVKKGRVTDYRFRLIPVFSDVITPDPGMQALVEEIRSPYRGKLDRVLGETQSLLYRRGNLNGTFDDLILAAIREARDAEIALSPGFRWGASLVPGQNITVDDVYNQTAITYPEVYRTTMTGARLKAVLEDVADNLFNPDPYYQQGGDMVRVAGLAYRLRVNAPAGRRIEQLSIMPGGALIDASREYVVTGWASVNEDVEGPPVYDIVSGYIESLGQPVRIAPNDAVQIV
ncbi:MAG: thiosulfohydrolase SoxB [Gammaproteobacteria bacterium]|nr:thiosulfohydrolase SoxB [Gammaproteobacteria bacterium]